MRHIVDPVFSLELYGRSYFIGYLRGTLILNGTITVEDWNKAYAEAKKWQRRTEVIANERLRET